MGISRLRSGSCRWAEWYSQEAVQRTIAVQRTQTKASSDHTQIRLGERLVFAIPGFWSFSSSAIAAIFVWAREETSNSNASILAIPVCCSYFAFNAPFIYHFDFTHFFHFIFITELFCMSSFYLLLASFLVCSQRARSDVNCCWIIQRSFRWAWFRTKGPPKRKWRTRNSPSHSTATAGPKRKHWPNRLIRTQHHHPRNLWHVWAHPIQVCTLNDNHDSRNVIKMP